MAKVTPSDRSKRETVVVKTKNSVDKNAQGYNWWRAKTKTELGAQLISTVVYLKENQLYRYRAAGVNARLYGNASLSNFAGSSFNKLGNNQMLPSDRPTMNVVQSCVDTLVSRITQSKPKPLFLTDGGDYKSRKLSKQMNRFVAGVYYETKAYELAEEIFRDAAILGTGCIHIFEHDKKVALERVLLTELHTDINDSFYGKPRTLYRTKLVDREVLADMLPKERSKIQQAEQAFPDNSSDSQKSISDQVMVVEGWHLPSGKDAGDGRHTIACTSGVILDEVYEASDFPFAFFHYSKRLVGFWAQSLAEQLTGTQVEINKLLVQISQAINLVGVPRVFIEEGSKVVKAHLNNQVGSIVTYRGTKPSYEVAPCVPNELYGQLERLINYAYQQSGISTLTAGAQKPAGLDSGEAIRSYDDIQSDRFASMSRAWNEMFIGLAYKCIDKAMEIAERDGAYQAIYPDKDGVSEIDLPAAKLLSNPFVIQCFDTNSLPKDPAGRKQTIIEYMQGGIISQEEGRRLLNFPDLEENERLSIAAEERILKILDQIVEEGKFTAPDEFINLSIAKTKVAQYYNLYVACGLEESKADMLRDFNDQLVMMEQAMLPPPMPGSTATNGASAPLPGGVPAVPTAPPTAELMPQAV